MHSSVIVHEHDQKIRQTTLFLSLVFQECSVWYSFKDAVSKKRKISLDMRYLSTLLLSSHRYDAVSPEYLLFVAIIEEFWVKL